MFPPLAERLARAGFVAVTFNMSGCGVDDAGEFTLPERFGHNTFSAELNDIRAVVKELRSGKLGVAPPTRLGLLGHSRGGGMSVIEAAEESRVAALVTWSAISHVNRWPALKEEWRKRGKTDIVNTRTGQVLPLYTDVLDDIEAHGGNTLDIRAAASRVRVPWLIVHGAVDESVPVDEARALASASGRASTELLIVEGGGHTFGAAHPFKGFTAELERATDASVAFLGKHLT